MANTTFFESKHHALRITAVTNPPYVLLCGTASMVSRRGTAQDTRPARTSESSPKEENTSLLLPLSLLVGGVYGGITHSWRVYMSPSMSE